jgi:two-component system sensor histidine kinase VicK
VVRDLALREGYENISMDDSSRWLAAMVESTNDAIISATLDLQIRSWNPGAEHMYGFTAEQMIGQHLSVITTPDRRHEQIEIVERIKRGESVSQYETVRQRKTGEIVHISLTASPVRDDSGDILGLIAIVQDISERKRGEAERERLFQAALASREEVEAALHVREQFLSVASHELRTPITSLLGYASMLQTYVPESTPDIRRMSERIIYQAGRLNELIEQLLDVSRIQRGVFAVDLFPVDLVVLVTQSVDNVRAILRPHTKHTIALSVPNEPSMVRADAYRLDQVIHQLLSNAIKYSPDGGVIDVRVAATSPGVVIEVTDHGIGIPAVAQAQVLEPFYRAANTGDGISGFGLGLYIVGEVVEHHHGRIEVESVEGKGSTFRIILPAYNDAPQA